MNNKKLINKSTNLAKEVISDAPNMKDYHTGAMFESVFASLFKRMPLSHKEKYRELLNKMIAEEKKTIRIIEHEKTKNK